MVHFTTTAFFRNYWCAILCFLLISFAMTQASCDGSQNESKPKIMAAIQANSSADEAAFAPSDNLYILYILNEKGHQQLKKFIGHPDIQKATFQFFLDNGGRLRLAGFPSKLKNEDFRYSDTAILRISNKKETVIPAGRTFLGDLQLDPATTKILKDKLYDPQAEANNDGWEVIWFVPRLVNEGSIRESYIIYDLKRSDEMPRAEKQVLMPPTKIGEANPSPPRRLE